MSSQGKQDAETSEHITYCHPDQRPPGLADQMDSICPLSADWPAIMLMVPHVNTLQLYSDRIKPYHIITHYYWLLMKSAAQSTGYFVRYLTH